MHFTLPKLPFNNERVSSFLSNDTIEIHYGRHHRNYIEKLNLLIKDTRFNDSTLEEIVLKADGELYHVAAQSWNHTFYWLGIGNGQEQSGNYKELLKAITYSFGSIDQMKKEFIVKANKIFGSGWVWLLFNQKKNILEIAGTTNADNPMKEAKIPLLVCDVWEHAYYIDFLNLRTRYVEEFFKVINWQFINLNFQRKEMPNMTDLMQVDSLDTII